MEYEVTKWADLQKPDHLRLKSVSGQPTKEIEQPVDPPVDPVVDINTDEDIGSHPDSFPTDDLNNIEDIEGPLHEHYIEHHGPHPDWVDDNPGIPSSEKEDFPPVNKCCRPYQRNDTKFRLQQVMLPTCILLIAKYSFIWECILYLMNLLTFFLITFAAFFAFFEESLSATVIFIDAVFSCDVLVRLAVEIWRYRNQVSVVIFSVRYSMAQFLLDLISITPFHQLFFEFVGSENLQYLGYVDFCKFNRFLRLYRSYAFFTMLQEERKDPLDFLLFRNREMLNGTWMRVVNQKKYGYPTEKPYQMYVLSTNFAAATVTTVGYGDTSPGSETEMIWCIFFMLFGAVFLNGYFISQLTTFELETDGARFDLFFRVREILKYLKSVGTLPLFDEKVVEYYKCLWSYRGGVYEVQFFKCLPPAFQEDLLYDICQEMFDKSFLFNGMDEALLRAIAKIVKVALYNPEMILCRKGDYANKMYYILQGECRVMSKYMSKTAAILRAGSIIGEANLFFSYPYTSSVETRTCCQFLILEKEELIIAMDDFRDQIAILRSKSQTKVFKLYDTHQIFGLPPVCWVGAKTDYDNPSEPKPSSIRRIMRWGSGRNKEVIEDVINDTKDLVIFDTPCERKEVVKNHLTPYITCTVPQIMDSMYKWVPYWNGKESIKPKFLRVS
ncbi:Potassium voltage-gated channel subfamily H member 2 [Folsomia candida]|uniref:Potassium voltage-gated channel subfamily H member 2 n=1 Tax=Folsomia candida TaxID=158441 RepID=A0A226EPN6_FOLCA|nr:Potassium voltage-gated channel subfamily H member 2 [Folsomia candida]